MKPVSFLFPGFLTALASASLAAAPIQLSTSQANGDVVSTGLTFTPNGAHVIYSGDLDADNVYEVYRASVSAADTQIKLNSTPVSGGDVYYDSIECSRNGSRVLYSGDLSTDGVSELYRASVSAAGTQIKLSSAPVAGGGVTGFLTDFNADGSKVVYVGDLTTNDVFALYSADSDASGTQIKLSSSMLASPQVDSFLLAPNGSRAVYRGTLTSNNVIELYSASIFATGTQIKLNSALVMGGEVKNYHISSDSTRVVFAADLDTNNVDELYSVGITGSGQIKLNSPPIAGGNVIFQQVLLTPTRAVYCGDLSTNGVDEIYSASLIAAGTQTKLNSTPVAGGDVYGVDAITPDGVRAIYRGDLSIDDVGEVYSASTSASGTQIKLSSTPVAGGKVGELLWLALNGTRVIYIGDLTTFDVRDLYSASTSASGTQKNLTSFSSSEELQDLAVSNNWVAYVVKENSTESLWITRVDGSSAPTRLSSPTAHMMEIVDFPRFTPDGTRVLYLADQVTDEQLALFSVAVPPLPVPAPSVKIAGKKKVSTVKARLIVKGTASGVVSKVTYRIGKKGSFKKVSGTAKWKFSARLKLGRNRVSVLASGPGGNSAPAKLTITRN